MPRERRLLDALRGALVRSRAAVLLVPAIAALVLLASAGAGYRPTAWYPVALFALALLVVGVATLRTAVPPLVATAAAALACYAAWCYLSIAWATQKADAWDGANRALLYAAVFALFALWRLRAPAAAAVLSLLALAVAGLALVELLRAAAATDPRESFIGGRFSSPATYQNANVALWTLALWPSVLLASRREMPTPARAALAAGAVILGAAALLGQSRGWLFAAPITALFVVAISPRRVRLVLTGLAVAATVAAISRPLLDVYDAAGTGAFGGAVEQAVRAIVLAAAALAALVGVVSVIERRTPRPSPTVERRAGRATLAAGLAAAVVTLAIFVDTVGSPVTAVANGWDTFKTEPSPTGEGSRFSQSLGSFRYDFWRVSWHEFTRRPVGGIGADNFQEPYLQQRRGYQEPRYPHSLEMQVLSQTGVVGVLVLAVALAAALAAAALALRRRRGIGTAVAAGGAATFASWFVHGSIDWFWEFPALGIAAFAALGLAAGLVPRRIWRERPLVRGPGAALAAVCVLVAAASFAAPWLEERWTDDALRSWRADPAGAFDRLETAADVNPLSEWPWLYAGAIAVERDRFRQAASYFRRALGREPDSQYAELELGLLAARAGRRAEALRRLERAAALNPRDEVGAAALRRVRQGRPVSIDRVNRALAAESARAIR